MKKRLLQTFALLALTTPLLSCLSESKSEMSTQSHQSTPKPAEIIVGAERLNEYLPLIEGKRVGLIVNQTSVIGNTHLVDTLLSLGINIQTIFAPEHGFRGQADAGAKVEDGKDVKTGLPIVSLYGKNKKPSPAQLSNIDYLIFDIQDVGTRFYTYISTMHYAMEACAENSKNFLVLDRPNPNGHYVDGPIREEDQKSFVGMHPIPIVHGLTVGELAQMINGEGWLAGGNKCEIKVISCENYSHDTPYSLPIKPSPNLPNDISIALYPSLCLFEGTQVSVGRGTQTQFQVIGSPYHPEALSNYQFTPTPQEGAKYPKHQDKACFGKSLQDSLQYQGRFFLSELIYFYQNSQKQQSFFNDFFPKLAGTTQLQRQIEAEMSEAEIRATWTEGLANYKKMREKYLIYGG